MSWSRSAVVLLAVTGLSSACSNGSPTKATTDNTPNFQGNYTGSSSVASCVEDAGFSGFCQGVGFTQGATFSTTVSLTQTQAAVTGTIAILGLTGTLQGTASGATGLTATGTLSDVTQSGVTLSSSITSWSTTLSGTALAGSYKIVFRATGTTGTATVTANIVQLSR